MSEIVTPRANAMREVIARCEFFREKLWEDPVGVAWEAQFSGCIALLRSVGHVLKDVDARSSKTIASNNRKWWASIDDSKPDPKIFWEFIYQERNLILKKSNIRAGQSAAISFSGVLGGEKSDLTPQVTYSYQMNEGTFAGRDPRELIDEAIAWWNQQVIRIETS